MSTYQLTSKQLLNNYAVVQTLEPTEVTVGESVTIAGLGSPFDGSFTVWQLPQYLFVGTDQQGFLQFDYNVPLANQVLYIA